MLYKRVKNEIVEREYAGKTKSWFSEVPSLIEIQIKSYEDFLQRERLKKGLPLENKGLNEVFKSVFPIISDKKDVLDYEGYTLDEKGIRYSEIECKKRGATYSIPAKATIKLYDDTTGEIKQKEIYIGDLPLMTERGTFLINGAERVVVSQIHRSPGIAFAEDKGALIARLIPSVGPWLEFEVDAKKKIIYAKINRKKKVLATIFLKALGFQNSSDIIELFYPIKKVVVKSLMKTFGKNKEVLILAKDVILDDKKILKIATPIYLYNLEELDALGVKNIEIVEFEDSAVYESDLILNSLLAEEKYLKEDQEELSKEDIISNVISMVNLNENSTEEDFQNLFFNEKRYSLGKVGRYKINKKFQYEEDKTSLVLEKDDIVNTLKYLIDIYAGRKVLDDIDHLGNRRVRSVGELLAYQIKKALERIEKVAKEKMSSKALDRSSLRPQDIISIKPVIGAIKEFFASSQLSQFMDQINPLAEITHKRRLNALGPGGLTRDRAGFEVRDIHYTHYGRVCPIETPEGPNIGLIVSLASYAKINEYGFIETPYRKVINGKVQKEIEYLSAIDEEKYSIAQANALIDDDGNFLEKQISSRKNGDYFPLLPKDIDYIDLSSRQIISVSTALIPFLEHDDASRALMGSNMQRQAVPLMFSEPPRVGTGMEKMIANNSGVIIKAKHAGVISYVSNTKIEIETENGIDSYDLIKYSKTNQDSCFNQIPIVELDQKVNKGDVIADGPSTFYGELALGKNVLVGFLPWNGYGFEDAVVISERIAKDDVFTSIHIKELTVDIRETKLGMEQITRDIPNVSEKAVSHLDENGIVRIGQFVTTNTILVGKVSPKSEVENTPELKLLNQIFGEKAKDIKDSSLRVPHGIEGTVVDVQILRRRDGDELPSTVEESIRVFIASKHKLREGDKIAGRHGNKGVISKVLPEEDMPFMEDGTPMDICLNPLGVPSRMNIGQILESQLGISAMFLDKFYSTPVFESTSIEQIEERLESIGISRDSKFTLYDGLSGNKFKNTVFVGCMYIVKLNHLVDHKMHARSTGPYSLITQQPLGGKAQFGGQRLGEMEVWALEAYGASYTLQEFLTIKSDNIEGRTKIYENIIKGYETSKVSGVPESFNVLMQELRGLGIDMTVYSAGNKQISLTEKDKEIIAKEEENF